MRHLLPIVVVACLAAAAAGSAAGAVGRATGDPLQAQEWWLADVGADRAVPPGPGVPITIVDSGLDVQHPEFAGRPDTVLLNDQTLAGPNEYHGTGVASLAAAPENGVGIVGVYPDALLQSWDATPGSTLSDLPAGLGIETAADRCPGVINLSFGGVNPDPFVAEAIVDAVHNGCLVVAAAGNGGETGNKTVYPASLPHVLTVAATGRDDRVASFSSAGAGVDVAAPGDGLVGALGPSSWGPLAGTSFAAPIVSAAAAWIWTERPDLDAGQVAELLRETARDVGAPGFDLATGFGIVDIPSALAAPAPMRDPWEPNDDVDQVKPGALFPTGEPALTTRWKRSNHVYATLDAAEDPRDLYRIWVPPDRTVRVRVRSDGNAAARIWGPQTVSVAEDVAERRRDLKGQSVTAGAIGLPAYVEVFLTGRRPRTSYALDITASRW